MSATKLSPTLRTIPLLIAVCLISVPAQAKYSGGTGEPNDPYQIGTAADWQTLMNTSSDWNKHFILSADIDLQGVSLSPVGKPGMVSDSFTGNFDGKGHIIRNAVIQKPNNDYIGLFGCVGQNGQIRNIGAINVTITGRNDVGGLVGYNLFGTLTKCYSTGMVSGSKRVGGLVGSNSSGTVAQCYSNSTVSGAFAGGLVGGQFSGTVTKCYSTGTISGSSDIGGLVGYNQSDVTCCYSTATVSGSNRVGGLVGYNNTGSVTQCYSTGMVSGNYRVGGLVGYGTGSVLHSVWDMNTSARMASAGGVGLTTAEMMDPYMLGLNGFADDPNWVLDAGLDYPRLAWQGTPGQIIPEPNIDWLEGSGTAEAPYQIITAEQLILLGKASILYEKHLLLGADINLDPNFADPNLAHRRIFDQAIIPAFMGVFDGNSHTISNLVIIGGSSLGLFGRLEPGAEVKNLGVEDVNVIGSGENFGGLVGYNRGEVTCCYATGSVGGSYVGGLVGYNNTGSVIQCYSTSTVSGPYAGGLVGSNLGIITQCYSTGMVSGSSSVGGLVGYGTGSVLRSVWDMNTSARTASAGGVGLTTAEMMDPYMLGLNGFANDPNWVLDAGLDYPRLAWQGTPGEVIPEPDINWLEGSGTAEAPYQIITAEQLILLRTASILCEKHFLLCADINLDPNFADPNLADGWVFDQAVIPAFTGVFDGNRHTISNIVIKGGSFLGLFGRLEPGAEVKNLGVEDVNVIGSGENFGGQVGYNQGKLTCCYSSGSVSGSNAGGLVGYNNVGSVTQCYSTGTVSGSSCVGGLVGQNLSGTVAQCYSRGMVSGTIIGYFGGLVGYNNTGSVIECYSTGMVSGSPLLGIGGLIGQNYGGTVNKSFWDIQTSGRTTSAGGGIGKTTAQMKTRSTFTSASAGWDFVGETANGTDDIWWINEGKDYPRLWWEMIVE